MVECGDCHRLNCKPCIEDWTKKNNSCPNCRTIFKPAANPNLSAVEKLNQLTFACACTTTFKYSDHLNHYLKCPTQQFLCPLPRCGITGNPHFLLAHWNETCKQIEYTCKSCRQLTTFEKHREHICVENLIKLIDQEP
jgi:hypothetical protein